MLRDHIKQRACVLLPQEAVQDEGDPPRHDTPNDQHSKEGEQGILRLHRVTARRHPDAAV
jgi:hypothetical protein